MTVMVVGYGSMGRRRVRLLQRLEKDCEIICVDSSSDRLEYAKVNGVRGFLRLEDALKENPDIAFVSTSPLSHADIIPVLLKNKIHTFTELNLTTKDYDSMLHLAKDNNVVLFMSSTMLYKKQIQKIKSLLNEKQENVSYIYHIGQYLPDWHPWESYKNFFIGKKESNGCREIFAIQLPWIVDTFGEIKSFNVDTFKNSSLDIDFNDSYIVNFIHKNGNHGVFIVDVVSRVASNYLEIVGENTYIKWDGSNDGLMYFDCATKEMINYTAYENVVHDENYASNIVENTYLDEIRNFLAVIKQTEKPRYSLEKDYKILNLIDRIEKK